jgi:hypothetical protein
MTIEVPARIAKPFKRWWRLRFRLELPRWLRTELEAESQSFHRGPDVAADDPAKKALPPP